MKSAKGIQYIKATKVELLWLKAMRDVKPTQLQALPYSASSIQLHKPRSVLQENMAA